MEAALGTKSVAAWMRERGVGVDAAMSTLLDWATLRNAVAGGPRRATLGSGSPGEPENSAVRNSPRATARTDGKPVRRKVDRIVSALKEQIPELAIHYRVKSLGVFGSYVRGEQKSRSDLDVLVEFSETPDIFQFMDLEQHLTRVLGVKVDLVSRKALKGRIGRRIADELIPV